MRASTSFFGQPNKSQDRIVLSFDNFTSYLLMTNEASRYAWVFHMGSKDPPPLDIIDPFLTRFSHTNIGSIQTNQGREFVRLSVFSNMVLQKHYYTVKSSRANSPSQNGAVEIYNDKLAIWVRSLLFGLGLPAKYWSAALQHGVYIHTHLIHTITKQTPMEGFFGFCPDMGHLKVFGARVCVKRSGKRPANWTATTSQGYFWVIPPPTTTLST